MLGRELCSNISSERFGTANSTSDIIYSACSIRLDSPDHADRFPRHAAWLPWSPQI